MNASHHSAISDAWALRYLGKPWVSGARGPDCFDCWGFLRWVQFHEFKRPPLPDYPISAVNLPEVCATISGALAGKEWTRLAVPVDGCAVALYRNQKVCSHVGVFVAKDCGIVVHALKTFGVIAQTLPGLRAAGWCRIDFYTHSSW